MLSRRRWFGKIVQSVAAHRGLLLAAYDCLLAGWSELGPSVSVSDLAGVVIATFWYVACVSVLALFTKFASNCGKCQMVVGSKLFSFCEDAAQFTKHCRLQPGLPKDDDEFQLYPCFKGGVLGPARVAHARPPET